MCVCMCVCRREEQSINEQNKAYITYQVVARC